MELVAFELCLKGWVGLKNFSGQDNDSEQRNTWDNEEMVSTFMGLCCQRAWKPKARTLGWHTWNVPFHCNPVREGVNFESINVIVIQDLDLFSKFVILKSKCASSLSGAFFFLELSRLHSQCGAQLMTQTHSSRVECSTDWSSQVPQSGAFFKTTDCQTPSEFLI